MAKNTGSTLTWPNIQHDFSSYIIISNKGNKRPEEVLENVDLGSVRIFGNDLSWNLMTIRYPNRRIAMKAARFLNNSKHSIEIRVRMATHTIAFFSQLERENYSQFKKPSYVMIDRFPGYVTLKRWTTLLSKFGNGIVVGFFRENSAIIVKFETLAEVVGIAIALHERVLDGNKLLVRLYRSEKENFLFSASKYDSCKCMTSNCPLHPRDQAATAAHSREKGKSPFAYRPLPCAFCHFPGSHPTTGDLLNMEYENTLDDANVSSDDEFPEFNKDKLAGDNEECFYHFDCHAPRVSDVGWEVIDFGDMEISNGERGAFRGESSHEGLKQPGLKMIRLVKNEKERQEETEGRVQKERLEETKTTPKEKERTLQKTKERLGGRESKLIEIVGLDMRKTRPDERVRIGGRGTRLEEREGLSGRETMMGEREGLGGRETRVDEREGLGGKEIRLNERERLAGRETRLEGRETRLEARETRLEARETRLQERESKLREQLIVRENRLEERESRLEEKENRLEEREYRLEERENRQEERESKLHEQLIGRANQLEEMESRLKERENRLHERESRLQEEENRVERWESGQREGENTLEEEKRETGKQTAWKGKQTRVKRSCVKRIPSCGRKR